MLKTLTNFSIEGVCSNKPSRQLLCKDYNRLHFEELRRNYWLFPSSNLWQLYETTRLDCATTLTSSVGISNQKHISMMANTFNASQSSIVANQFQAWQARIERNQEENERQMQSLLQQAKQPKQEIRSCELRWPKGVVRRAIAPFLNRPSLIGVVTK